MHLEGRQSILAALQARRRRFELLLVAHGAHTEKFQDVLDLAAAMSIPIRQVDPRELDNLAHGATHGGLLAICSPKPLTSIPELFELLNQVGSAPRTVFADPHIAAGSADPATLDNPARTPSPVHPFTRSPLLLLLEGIEDARNLGFVIRTAEATGVHAVLIKKHIFDLDPAEIARPASGAYEKMPLVQIESVEPLQQLQKRGLRLLGCLAGVKRTCYEADLTAPTILAIGGEKRGLSGAVRSICDGFLTIPTVPGASSLSLSHAAAMLMGEAMRQRVGKG